MIELKNTQWGQIRLADIFDEIPRGKVSDLKNVADGKTIIIAASGANEGFSCFSNDEPISKNAMTISFNGVGTGTAFVHNYLFNLNSDCGLVKPKENISLYALRFIAVSINQNKNKFNYGYKANESRILRQTVLLPISDDKDNPDYAYMAEYAQQKRETMLNKYLEYVEEHVAELEHKDIPALDEKEWKPIFISSMFELVRGCENNMAMLEDGYTPLISAKANNNGLKGFVHNPKKIIAGQCITLNNDGDGGAGLAYYQPANMALDSHVTALVPLFDMSAFVMLFIAKCISGLHGFFGHGLSISNPRAKRLRIMLPVTDTGEPDYAYMEQYSKNMMLRKYKQYLEFINRQNVTEVD
ncbi:restriction endonuclease subunit S [[Clostridium] innocuum]|uniref:restriction endonuclease subunit S n=1 Tax=Clostridium innocuum TaxID=1522 RepID=UPI001C243395|nr:restriction endonuclease subunit S [[Clostridium] innocuum]MBU9115434.1 restriction endonuclease subunit S [[Clostridium] innocuum]